MKGSTHGGGLLQLAIDTSKPTKVRGQASLGIHQSGSATVLSRPSFPVPRNSQRGSRRAMGQRGPKTKVPQRILSPQNNYPRMTGYRALFRSEFGLGLSGGRRCMNMLLAPRKRWSRVPPCYLVAPARSSTSYKYKYPVVVLRVRKHFSTQLSDDPSVPVGTHASGRRTEAAGLRVVRPE